MVINKDNSFSSVCVNLNKSSLQYVKVNSPLKDNANFAQAISFPSL